MSEKHTPPPTRAVAEPAQSGMPVRRRRNLTILTLLFIVVALGFLLMYFLVWQHQEETDDAYVGGHLVQITPQIGGTVQSVAVTDMQAVKAKQLLVTLDDSDIQLAYERARSELINAIRQNRQQTAVSAQAQAQVLAKKAQLARLQTDLQRRESLAGTDAVSGEELSHARAAVIESQAALSAALAQEKSAKAMIGDDVPLRQQPLVLTAISRVKNAWLDLQRTQIRAPMNGQIAKRNVQIGQKVAPGAPLMVVVPLHNLWVDANFKESQLAKMRLGQPAKVTADIYGSKVTYQGKVAGLSAGTGSAFSLLPAQNATGNWIKVVQRVPVRIELDAQQLAEHPLRVGLSMTVSVDTEDQGGIQMAVAAVDGDGSQMPAVDWAPVDAIIDAIFAQYAR